MDDILTEMGVENAAHKAVGPVDVIKWLGLLIDCRPDRTPCIRLPESKRMDYLLELKIFYFRYRQCKKIPARSMAEILGRLNFAAKTHAGGPFFMSRKSS